MTQTLPYEKISDKELFYYYKQITNNEELTTRINEEMFEYIENDLGKNHLKNWVWLYDQSQYKSNILRIYNYLSDNEWKQQYNSYRGDIIAKELLKSFIYHSVGWWLHYSYIKNPTPFPYKYWQAKQNDFIVMYRSLSDKSTPYIMEDICIE